VCGLVLVAYAVVALFPGARNELDRVSFRLLVQALIFHVLFGISYALSPVHPGRGCDFAAFAVNFTLSFTTFYMASIAINLQLVLVHGVNGKMMEKYYVIVTVVLSCALNIPPYALGQFGWNDLSETCWYSNPDDRARLKWIVATQSLWICLAAVIEMVCSSIILYWLYRYWRAINSLTPEAPSSDLSANVRGGHPEKFWFPDPGMSIILSRDPTFRKIVIRIALYPIVSLIFNIGTVALDLHISVTRVKSQLDYRLLVVDLFLLGARTFAYALLASWDPSFVNAVQKVCRSWSLPSIRTKLNFALTQTNTDDGKLSADVEQQQASISSSNSQGSKDEMGALHSQEERESIERQL